ncbi:Bromodomain adjacent to zinc finger domain protein like [Actinidia chinensis var. chinensis]|uniref:Bromodomain adjacent to zinc finger domain protein like n=1 Tax=Actinidia chinensis var. chinensis TaxID=1590841 RepID=A0A2R6PTG2_ACTCC|nr:Bromodomain adjacent to zinc finger domain protein like [Actinidia chinensis var. chinensis]
MPRDRRGPPLYSCRSGASPYPCIPNNTEQYKSKDLSHSVGNEKDWEEVRCPICMDHPHNAVLLLCSSRETGCHPYMCDTSYRHSNCLDQFRKSSAPNPSADLTEDVPLFCPLCRGQINRWTVIEPARKFMNSKPRSCSLETCDFGGTYSELRKHARHEHPSVRPSEADSGRQLKWMRLERERNLQDIVSSASPLEPGWDWDDWLGLEVPLDDLSEFLELEPVEECDWDGFLDIDIGIELPFTFFEASLALDPLNEMNMSVSSGVNHRSHNTRTTARTRDTHPLGQRLASRTGGSWGSRSNRSHHPSNQRRLRRDY